MNTLHILTKNKRPDLLQNLNSNDAILLVQDAVYLLLNNSFKSEQVYVLADDLHARMPHANYDNILLITYPEFVELCCSYNHNVTW